jgi:hypothetical protein
MEYHLGAVEVLNGEPVPLSNDTAGLAASPEYPFRVFSKVTCSTNLTGNYRCSLSALVTPKIVGVPYIRATLNWALRPMKQRRARLKIRGAFRRYASGR